MKADDRPDAPTAGAVAEGRGGGGGGVRRVAGKRGGRRRSGRLTFKQNVEKVKGRNRTAVLRLFPALFEIDGQWVKLVE